MRLDFDCVRDVLFCLEELTDLCDEYCFKLVTLEEITDEVDKYRKEDIYYTLLKLDEAGFIRCLRSDYVDCNAPCLRVIDITYEGHNYLNAVRNDQVWNKIKAGAKSLTFGIAAQAAESFILSKLNF